MPDLVTVYRWHALEQNARGRPKKRLLRWHMSEDQAARWAQNNGKTLEKVAGSAEVRRPEPLRPSGGAMKTPGIAD